MANYKTTLKVKYINFIKEGEKTIEGRINTGLFAKIKAGDTIEFFSKQEKVNCKIKLIKNYSSFKEMLESEGLDKILPNVETVEGGVNTYNSFPRYKENSKKYGVLALHLQVLD
ncbi:MAG: ASCH domain-containing protein [Patescibacteria group bacterium]